ncbi:DMT family transporter [Kibdelosporangium phytohabitans]|uniref:DMT family transporter n=1 Tax=Kibdelosporangium phytohabitans TaxID=860235 RepID=UPI0007C76815|nr:DMT family transporter [Kibdelosporangium phytohabitans]MBE1467799.1 drug/metabolite transporter (DMT)-like permease [Kibdelosporangium phytohabitans]
MNKAMVAAGVACVLVGASVPVTGMLDGYPILAGQAIRYAVGALTLLLWLRGRLKMPSWRDTPGLIGMVGAGMLGFNAGILVAQRYATPGFVAAVLGASPLVLAVIAPAMAGKMPNPRTVVGALLVVTGVVVLTGGGSWHGPGLVLSLLVLAGEASFTLAGVGVVRRIGPAAASTWACVGAAVGGSVFTTWRGEWALPTWQQALALVLLGVLVTAVGFVFWYRGVSALGADRVGVLIGLMPLSGLGVAVIVGAQPLTITALFGALVVALGCAAGLSGNRDRSRTCRRRRDPAPTPEPAPTGSP